MSEKDISEINIIYNKYIQIYGYFIQIFVREFVKNNKN